MDFTSLMGKRKDCLIDAPPLCSGACPLGLDVRDFIRKIRSGLYSAAFKVFKRFSVLPGIACHICDEPCQKICARGGLDEAISLRGLELFCWRESRQKPIPSYFSPPKAQRILIIGGGPSGLACAVKLAERQYQVELVEKKGSLGGRLLDIPESILPRSVFEEELEAIYKIKHLRVTLNEAKKKPKIPPASFDAVVIATGNDGGIVRINDDHESGWSWKNGVFWTNDTIGSERSPLVSINQGVAAAQLVEEYLRIGRVATVSKPKPVVPFSPDLRRVEPVKKSAPADGRDWTTQEAESEAGRCLLCACSNCSDVCMMMRHYKLDFKKLASKIADTVVSTRIEERKTALFPVMSCTQCGSCKTACPVGIDPKTICLESRRILHQNQQLPDSHYEFWLNDMRQANSDEAALFVPANSLSAISDFIYFPGCQMGASKPDYVTGSYRWLEGAGLGLLSLFLYCCGAPAAWAGDRQGHEQVLEAIRAKWREAGKPPFILACPTCTEMFQKYLPEIENVSLWEIMADRFPQIECAGGPVAVFDPCASGDRPQMRAHIRMLTAKAGYTVQEIEKTLNESICCGHGGLIYSTNPGLFRSIVEHNASLSDYEYITYCTNCVDNFTVFGKASRHILDLLLGLEPRDSSGLPGLTERRTNRTAIKKRLLNEKMKLEYIAPMKSHDHIKLILSPEIQAQMNALLIVEDNIKQVLEYAEETGRKSFSSGDGFYTAYASQGSLTFWVRYVKRQEGYVVANVYYHRLSIVEA